MFISCIVVYSQEEKKRGGEKSLNENLLSRYQIWKYMQTGRLFPVLKIKSL